MKRFLAPVVAAAAFVVLLPGLPARAPADVTTPERCNTIVASQLDNRVRQLDKRAPATNELADRYNDLQRIISEAAQEEEILENTCPSDASRAPIDVQLGATAAWAYALQSDVVRAKFAITCQTVKDVAAAAFVATAWRELAEVAPPGQATPAPALGEVIPKVESRASAVGLTLPSLADASNYWATQQQDKAKEATEGCPQ